MTILQAIILGIVQGATEFLPISSSAHLVLVPALFGWHFSTEAAFVFDVLVQVGTLIAVVAYFRDDLWQVFQATWQGLCAGRPLATAESRLGWWIVLATLPAVGLGLWLKPLVERSLTDPRLVGVFLIGTALLLTVGERWGQRSRPLSDLRPADALWIGFAQVLALFPGISRSGATISGGMTRHLERSAAARFSFLMAVPVMVAAAAIALLDFFHMDGARALALPMLSGFLTSTLVGYLSIRWLMGYLRRHPLYVFVAYCLVVGVLAVFLLG